MLNVSLVGDMESYWYLGEAVGYRSARNSLAFWTKLDRKYKIKILSKKERVEYGGYGILPK